ncbi:MAG: hypothetical protein AB1714_23055 [Acidobacteriota bacterium]
MKLDDRGLKALYADSTSRCQQRRQDCIQPHELIRFLSGEVDPEWRSMLVAHLIDCSECSSELQALKTLQTQPEAVHPTSQQALRRRFSLSGLRIPLPRWRLVASAATLAATGFFALTLWQLGRLPDRPDSSVRGTPSRFVAVNPMNSARLRTAPERLEWTTVTGAETYRVTVYDFESKSIWSSPAVEANGIPIPSSVRSVLAGDGRWYWRVTAQIGIDRLDSPLFEFTVEKSDKANR